MVEQAGFIVAGTAESVAEAERLVHRRKPDLVLADVRLQDGDGIELTRRVLAERGVPIILITAHDPANPDLVFRAIEAGALDVLAKPPAATDPGFEAYRRSFETALKSLAGTPIVRRRPRPPEPAAGTAGTSPVRPPVLAARPELSAPPLVAIAASTGGPLLIGDLLKALPEGGFAFAVIVQHIVPDFADSFRSWLGEHAGRRVLFAEEGRMPVAGGIYLAPPNCHVQLHVDGTFRTPSALDVPAAHVPSADVLFASLAGARPAGTLAIQLTGMGSDGAEGLASLRAAGAHTIVQSPETAAVDGMPRSAIERGAASEVLRPDQIAELLRSLKRP
jgi:two-component system chemotaxis response regulator CheB